MGIYNFKKRKLTFQSFSVLLLFVVASATVASLAYLHADSSSNPEIILNQSVDITSPKPGDKVSFNISYLNPTSSMAYNVTVFEFVPSGLTFISSKPFYDGISIPDEGFYRWSRGNVVPGESGKIIISLTVDNVINGTIITNTVHLTYEYENGTTVELISDVSITVAHGAGVEVYPDQIHGVQPSTNAETSYNISVTNTGNAPDVFDISLSSLAYDPNLSGDKSWIIELYNSAGQKIVTLLDSVSTSHSSWTDWGNVATVSLGAGQSAWFIIRVIEPGGTSGSGDAYLNVRLTATSRFDPSVSGSALTITVVRKAVGITISPDYAKEANPGETVTFLHEIYNGGGFGGSDQTIVIDLSYTSSQGWIYYFYFQNGTSLRDTDNNGLVDVGPVAKDQSVYVLFKVMVPYGTAAGTADHAIITARGMRSGKEYVDTAYDNTTVRYAPLVGVTKKLVSVNPAYSGDSVTYRINVTNLGNTKLVTVPLDDGFETSSLDFLNAIPTPDSYSEIAGTIHWENLTSLTPLQRVIITVNFVARASDSVVRESANVIDAEDEFGNLVSAVYINTELRTVELYTLTVTASPPEALGGVFQIDWAERGIAYSSTFSTPKDVTCDDNTNATISNPQDVIISGNVRYVFNDYSVPSPTVKIISNTTVTLNYRTQYLVTFTHAGLDDSATGTIVTVNDESKAFTDLPFSLWVDSGASVRYSYVDIALSSTSGKRFRLDTVSGPGSPITVIGPTIVTGNYVVQYYLTVVSSHGTYGGMGWYDGGDTAYATVTPLIVPGPFGVRYVFTHWSGNASGTTSPSDPIIMSAPKTATANWKTQYYLTVATNPAEVLSLNSTAVSGQGWYDSSFTATVDAVQNVNKLVGKSRYNFRSWTGATSTSVGNSAEVFMNGPKTVIANYQLQYKVVFYQSGVGLDFVDAVVVIDSTSYGRNSVSFWWDNGSLHTFAFQSLLIVEPNAKQYVWVSTTGLSTLQEASITVSISGNVTSTYKTQYYLTVNTEPAEVLTLNSAAVSGEGWYDSNSTAIVTAVQNIDKLAGQSIYDFRSWSGATPTGVGNDATAYMDGPKTVTANYQLQYNIVFVQSGVGTDFGGTVVIIDSANYSVTTLPSSFWWDKDSTHSFTFQSSLTVTANTKRYLWEGTSGLSSSQSDAILVSTSGNITGNFETQYYINVSSAHDSPTASAWVDAGDDFTASVTSPTEVVVKDHQWVCTGFSVDGGVSQVETSYTFTNVQMAHTITFSWKQQFWIQVNSVHDSPTASQWVDQSGSLTVGVTSPADDDGAGTRYRCTGYTLDDNTAVTDGSTGYNFADVQSAHVITFSWIAQYRLIVTSVHDSPNPVGTNWYDAGYLVSASVVSPADDDRAGTRYRCTGFTGTGSAPSGTEASTSFNIAAPSTLTWNWVAQYRLTVSSDHDAPEPSVGEHWYDTGTSVIASVSSPADDDGLGTRYGCTGYAGSGSVPSFGTATSVVFTIDAPSTITWNWKTEYSVTFAQTGLDSTVTGTILTVNGVAKEFSDLPYTVWVDLGDYLNYSYIDIVSSSVTGKRFIVVSITGPDSPVTVTEPFTSTGNYKMQYYLTMSTNLGTVSPSSGWYDTGSTVQISAYAPGLVEGNGYAWHGWTGTGTISHNGLVNPANITINSPITETAYWKILPELTIFVSEETVAKCDRIVVYGTTLPADPNTEVQITYTFPNGTQVAHTVQTDDEGRYNDTLILTGNSLYGLFDQGGQWQINVNRTGDTSHESATGSTTLGIAAPGVSQIPPVVVALLIVTVIAAFYLIIERRMNGKKLNHKTWWGATVILGLTGLAFGIASLALNWMLVTGTANMNTQSYLVDINLHPFNTGSVSITGLKYIGSEIPSLISSQWLSIPKSPGPVIALYLAPIGCILALACLYKPRTERERRIKALTLVIAGALILIPVAQSFLFMQAQASTTAGASTGYGLGLYIAMIGGLLAILASLFAARETPTGIKRASAV